MPLNKKTIRTGVDLVEKLWPTDLKGARAGLVVHPASVDLQLRNTVDIGLNSKKYSVTVLFGPQHGILGQTQDNMIEWEGFRDPATGLPVYSLYGKTRKPEPGMLENVDALVIDLQDVGSRYYTFVWTLDLCMQACYETGKTVVVLDRPNPLNGVATEGPVLDPALRLVRRFAAAPGPARYDYRGNRSLSLREVLSGPRLSCCCDAGLETEDVV